ncbi:MAG: substrate-binding domain-containing protein [Chitinophagales bacterium]
MQVLRKYIFLLPVLFLLAACKDERSTDDGQNDLNKGEIAIYADTSYQSIVKELVRSYENVYPEAHINVTYAGENELMQAMYSDKTRMIITGRGLSQQEIDAIEKVNGIVPKQFVVGREAVAIISNIASVDSTFDLDAFRASRMPGYAGAYANKLFVFNNANAGIVGQLTGSADASYQNMFSLQNSDTLIAYVAAHPDAFGFLSFAELSDGDSEHTRQILEKVRILGVSFTDTTGQKVTVELSQSSLGDYSYPLQRPVNVIKGNMPELLGTGFVNFLYRSKAARIFLKAGLIPDRIPERQIKIVE